MTKSIMSYSKNLSVWESFQYNAANAITCPIKCTSSEKPHLELGLESLKLRWWLKKISFIKHLINNHHLIYSAKFHINPQITKLPETMTTI